jgi:hypothetical protein
VAEACRDEEVSSNEKGDRLTALQVRQWSLGSRRLELIDLRLRQCVQPERKETPANPDAL